jgi:acyl-CoA thioester hydrolase
MEFVLRVRFHELDPYGHVNHGVYLNWFETARIEAMEALGFGLPTLRDRGIHLVVTEVNLRFLRPALAGDEVVVESEIRDLRRATSWWHQRAVRDGDVLAEVDVRSGSVDPTGRPVTAPRDLVAALQSLRLVEAATT